MSAIRIGLVGSQPVLWKMQRRRPHSVTKHDLVSSLNVQVPPVAIPVQSGCSHTGSLKLVPRLNVAEFVLTTLSGPSENGLGSAYSYSSSSLLLSLGVLSEIVSQRFTLRSLSSSGGESVIWRSRLV